MNYENTFLNSNIDPTKINENSDFQSDNFDISLSSFRPLNIEILNAKAKSNIKIINRYLNELNSLNDEDENILFVAEKLSNNKENLALNSLIDRLLEINKEIDAKSVIYKNNDSTLKMLKTQKLRLSKLLKNQSLAYLQESKKFEKANYELSLRNNEVLLKYKALRGDYLRNKKVLDSLLEGAQILSLENAKFEDPWKLITNQVSNTQLHRIEKEWLQWTGNRNNYFLIIVLIDEKKKVSIL